MCEHSASPAKGLRKHRVLTRCGHRCGYGVGRSDWCGPVCFLGRAPSLHGAGVRPIHWPSVTQRSIDTEGSGGMPIVAPQGVGESLRDAASPSTRCFQASPLTTPAVPPRFPLLRLSGACLTSQRPPLWVNLLFFDVAGVKISRRAGVKISRRLHVYRSPPYRTGCVSRRRGRSKVFQIINACRSIVHTHVGTGV